MPADNPNEQELQFKKRARRRLVGAVALVLLMITVLPMLLDDRAAKAPPQDIAISIPSQDGDEFSSKIVPVAPDNQGAGKTDSGKSGAAEEQAITDTESSPPVNIPPSASEAAPPIVTPTETPKVEAAPVKPQPPKSVKSEPKVEPVKTAAKADAAKEAVSAKPEPAKKTEAAASGFVVQIGVFSDPDNVKQMQQKLSGLGLKSGTEKIATAKGDKIRLRTTVFAQRADAEKALAKIQGAGLAGMVVSNK